MRVQLGLGAEAFAARDTRERLVAGVDSHVRRQRPLLQELLTAQRTRVRNAPVQLAVVHQLELARERSPTIGAHERINRPVEPRVHHQVLLLGKALAAVLAHVRTLSGVELAVRDQVTLQRERTATLLADKGPLPAVDARVRQQVMLQREALLALLALIGPVRRVQQQMGVQAVLVGKIFATVDAHVRSFTYNWEETTGSIRYLLLLTTGRDDDVRRKAAQRVLQLTGVNPGVGRQVVLQQERFAALVARVRPLLRDHVWRGRVRLLLDVLILRDENGRISSETLNILRNQLT